MMMCLGGRVARINIEDSLFRDKRFLKLTIKLCCSTTAIGALVEAWCLAQKYYAEFVKTGEGSGLIPQLDWDDYGLRNEIIDVGLAEKRGEFIYVKGTKENFDWYGQRLKAASAGGKKSAERPRDERGRLQAVLGETPSEIQAKPSKPKSPAPAPSPAPALDLKELNHTSSGNDENVPLVRIWNQNCGTLPKVKALGKERKPKAKARWAEHPSESYWIEVVQKMASSAFCNGQSVTGWRASFDFLIKPDTQYKILEGRYDSASKQQQKKFTKWEDENGAA